MGRGEDEGAEGREAVGENHDEGRPTIIMNSSSVVKL